MTLLGRIRADKHRKRVKRGGRRPATEQRIGGHGQTGKWQMEGRCTSRDVSYVKY